MFLTFLDILKAFIKRHVYDNLKFKIYNLIMFMIILNLYDNLKHFYDNNKHDYDILKHVYDNLKPL